MARIGFALLLFAALARAQTSDPAYQPLDRAYKALRDKDYDTAVAAFQQAIGLAPERAAIRKDLAYTLLKIGENEAAREQFGAAARLQPADDHTALEYAFLCYETHKQTEARRIFDRIRKHGNATAEQAFQNIDRPLAEGIARWQKALESTPDNFSAHYELARLAEQRDEIPLAAEHYEKAWRIKPAERDLLLDLGRVWQAQGLGEKSFVALLAASRGAQPRVSEKARELMPARYPYVYEFRTALDLDPNNVELRRELAYLLLEMKQPQEAEQEFETVHRLAPDDRLSTAQLGFLKLARQEPGAVALLEDVLKQQSDDELADRVRSALRLPQTLRRREDTPRRQITEKARTMAEKSFKAGYLKDALRYYNIAQESDPVDFGVMLKLGWTYNMLHDDRSAVEWFRLARNSADASVATEAQTAYKNLEGETQLFHVTTWMFPFFSTRWHDVFGYAQTRADLKVGKLFHVYASARFIGDSRETATLPGAMQVEYLSEDSVIAGIGVATNTWHGATGWFEAGESMKYLPDRTDEGSMIPDFRGGISYVHGYGHAGGGRGPFAEINGDAVFVSRFDNDMLFYPKVRTGYSFGQVQTYWNYDVTTDTSRQYWANFAEMGPGVRFHVPDTPKSLLFSVNALHGVYFSNVGNPMKPNFNDLRAGFWYAFTH